MSTTKRITGDYVIDPTGVMVVRGNLVIEGNVTAQGIGDTNTSVTVSSLAASSGSSTIGHISTGTGSVATTVQAKLREIVSVKDKGAVGDGVTSDQTALVAAVADAYANGAALTWPAGTYVSTASIPNFHKVRHSGRGVIKRGSETYRIEGAGTNALYVTVAGNAANDGLSATEPMAVLQNAFDAVANVPQPIRQKFNINIGAGTYSKATAITFTAPTNEYVDVIGASVGGHPNVPTTIFDGAGGVNYAHGIYISGQGVRVKCTDLKGINFNGDSANKTRGFIVFDQGPDGWVKNCHVTNATWFGVYGTSSFFLRVEGGVYDGCRQAILTDNTRCSVGWLGTTTTNRPLIKNSTETGIYWSRGTQGHIDYCDVQDNAVGVDIAESSRCDAVDIDFKRNVVAARAITGGMFGNNPSAPCRFNTGTADANGVNIKTYAASLDYTGLYEWAKSEYRIVNDRTPGTHTGVTGDTFFRTLATIAEGFFRDGDQKIRIKAYGIATSATTAPQLKLAIAGVSIMALAFPANAIAGLAFEYEVELFSNGAGNHRVTQKINLSGSAPRMGSQSLTFNFVSGAQLIDLRCNLAATGDSLAFNRIEVFAMG